MAQHGDRERRVRILNRRTQINHDIVRAEIELRKLDPSYAVKFPGGYSEQKTLEQRRELRNHLAEGLDPDQIQLLGKRARDRETKWFYSNTKMPTQYLTLLNAGYNPNEERDELGRWTSGGTSETNATSTMSTSEKATQKGENPSSKSAIPMKAGKDAHIPTNSVEEKEHDQAKAKPNDQKNPQDSKTKFTIDHNPHPPDSQKFTLPDGTTFLAPAGTDFEAIYKAGQADWTILPSQNKMSAAVGQYGKFDFQRNRGAGLQPPGGTNTFYPAYTDASNYAVGVYMNGAGYPVDDMRIAGETYAAMHSKQVSPNAEAMWIRGWNAAQAGHPNGVQDK